MALDGIPLDHPWRIVQGVIPGAPAGSAIRIEKHADRYRVITAVGAMDAATTAVEPQSDGRLLVRNPECGVRLLLEPTGHSRASDTVGRALLLPFVVAAVGMVLAWWLMLAAPSGGDTWGLRFLFEIPLASGSVGLLAGGASAHSDRSVGFLGGLVGYCVATLALELAWPSHYMIQFGLLAGLPFVLAYGLGRVGARYLARHQPVRSVHGDGSGTGRPGAVRLWPDDSLLPTVAASGRLRHAVHNPAAGTAPSHWRDRPARMQCPEDLSMSHLAGPTTARGILARHWHALVWGAIGIFFGLWTGNWASAPGMLSLGVVFPLAASGLVGVVVLVAAARAGNRSIWLLAFVGAWCIGFVVAPGAPGSTHRASGTGTAGTRADPTALWSGAVSCEWPKDEATSIDRVRGFDVPITDAAFLAAEQGVRDVRVTSVLLDPHFAAPDGGVAPNGGVVYEATRDEEGWIGIETFGSTPQATVFEETGFWHMGADLEGVSADGRTGTAVLAKAGDIVFQWRCSGGP